MSVMTRRATLTGASVLALSLGTWGLGSLWMEHRIDDMLRQAGLIADIAADPITGRVDLTKLHTRHGGAVFAVGHVRIDLGVGLFPPAFADGDVTLTDISGEAAGVSYSIPRITATGSSLDAATLATLLKPADGGISSGSLKQFNATSVTIPELIVTQKTVPEFVSTTTYRDLAFNDVVAGKIASAKGASGSMTASGRVPQGEKAKDDMLLDIKGTFGPWSGSQIDLALLAHVIGEPAGPEDADLRTLYGSFEMSPVDIDYGNGFKVHYQRLSSSDIKARAGKTPLVQVFNEIRANAAAGTGAKLPPEENARIIRALMEVFDNFSIGAMSAEGLTFDGVTPDGKVKGAIDRFDYAGSGNTFSMGPVKVAADMGANAGVDIGIRSIAMSGYSLKPFLVAVLAEVDRKNAPTNDPAPKPPASTAFLPLLGTFEIAGVEARWPQPADKSVPSGFSLGSYSNSFGDLAGVIPTAARVAFKNLKMTVPAKPKDDPFKTLAALGYSDLDMSASVDGKWDRTTQDFAINAISFDDPKMGSFNVTGLLGNVSPDAFSTDEALAQVAWMSATAKTLNIDVKNAGLAERLLAMLAKQQGKKPDDLRKQYGSMVAMAAPMFLGTSDQAKAVSSALARFIAKPGVLSIAAKACDAGGVGLADVTGAPAPGAVMEKLDVKATAQ